MQYTDKVKTESMETNLHSLSFFSQISIRGSGEDLTLKCTVNPAGDKSWSALRRLHMARRVERSLLSYERSGWLEDTTVVTKHSEIRPSSEMGPIICCLDTSGSMHGARETVAKVAIPT